ncbi:hypothetical protein V7x_17510 [Crateriforma conspicua]|uniref:Uncharacterized protein n=1 Tax=Crateriforma conspicua TaxID=2527996 RepID=A0A5C6FYU1_9PLAN|nr:hypothetical protein V7x_17510 [Crateriforma conspicua]
MLGLGSAGAFPFQESGNSFANSPKQVQSLIRNCEHRDSRCSQSHPEVPALVKGKEFAKRR